MTESTSLRERLQTLEQFIACIITEAEFIDGDEEQVGFAADIIQHCHASAAVLAAVLAALPEAKVSQEPSKPLNFGGIDWDYERSRCWLPLKDDLGDK